MCIRKTRKFYQKFQASSILIKLFYDISETWLVWLEIAKNAYVCPKTVKKILFFFIFQY